MRQLQLNCRFHPLHLSPYEYPRPRCPILILAWACEMLGIETESFIDSAGIEKDPLIARICQFNPQNKEYTRLLQYVRLVDFLDWARDTPYYPLLIDAIKDNTFGKSLEEEIKSRKEKAQYGTEAEGATSVVEDVEMDPVGAQNNLRIN